MEIDEKDEIVPRYELDTIKKAYENLSNELKSLKHQKVSLEQEKNRMVKKKIILTKFE